ncbi:MAG: hypothetical protein ABJN40_21840 [Sneathiella sp.]
MTFIRKMSTAIFVFCCLNASVLCAEDAVTPFHEALKKANTPYKNAMNYLHTGNVVFAGIELEEALANWRQMRTQYEKAAPGAYADDQNLAWDMAAIEKLMSLSLTSLESGDIDNAEQSLAPIRRKLHDLRSRNGVIMFADEYEVVSVQMDALMQFRRPSPELGKDQIRHIIKQHAEAFYKAILASDARATPTMRKNEIYQRLMGTAKTSSPAMIKQIEGKNTLGFINYLRELKSIERMLYLHFG